MTANASSPEARTFQPSELELERRAFRRTRGRRSLLVSVLSTLVFAALLALLLAGSPGWAKVQASFFDFGVAADAFPRVIKGLWLNVQVLAVSVLGVAIFGTLLVPFALFSQFYSSCSPTLASFSSFLSFG